MRFITTIKTWSFFFFVFIFQSLSAQDYTPIRKGWTYQFATPNKDTLITLRADLAYLDKTDSVFELDKKYFGYYYLNGNLLYLDYDQMHDTSYSNILGRKIIKTADKMLYFITRGKDTLVLKPFVALNTSWTFSKKRNLQATLSSKTYEDVFGIKDSVATFTLNNGKQIKLSKNFGFYSTTIAFEHLENTQKFTYINFNNFILDAIQEPGLGNYFLKSESMFNYEKGDVWGQSDYKVRSPNPNEYLYGRIFYEVIDKDIINNTAAYKIKRTTREIKPANKLVIDTITLDELKEQQWIDFYFEESYERLTYEIKPNSEGKYYYSIYSILNNSLRMQSFDDFESSLYKVLYPGIGLYYDYNRGWADGEHSNRLTTDCYKKGSSTFGDCDDFLNKIITSNQEAYSKEQIIIAPNPSNGYITVQSPLQNTSFEILNNQGHVVLTGLVEHGRQNIDLMGLSNGFYFIRIITNNQFVIKKIVIEK